MRSPIKRNSSNAGFKVKVAVRVRPILTNNDAIVVNGNEVTATGRQAARTFAFDRCFDDRTSQQDIYGNFGHDIVEHALEGYNACIFAYGQTGSGKSYTMLGTEENPGLIPQICQTLFDYVHAIQNTSAVTIRVSFLEIYNEQVRDLLGSSASSSHSPSNLRVRGAGGDDCWVEGLSEYKVTSSTQVIDLLQKGAKNRSTAATKMNDTSSRSHAVVTITIKQQCISQDPREDSSTVEKVSVLRLVDLAGSERAGSTGARGERLREGSNINKSLVTLGRVISTLADLHQSSRESNSATTTVVPYRESILTRLLQNSLGGNSRTAMIACISPDTANFDQTLSTLRYADQAKRITTRAHINKDTISNETHEARLASMQKELNELRQQLATQPSQEDSSKMAKLVQFYEDEAARERVRSKMLELQKQEVENHAMELGDYIREISGKGISSIDVPNTLNFESLLSEYKLLERDVTAGRQSMKQSILKWKALTA